MVSGFENHRVDVRTASYEVTFMQGIIFTADARIYMEFLIVVFIYYGKADGLIIDLKSRLACSSSTQSVLQRRLTTNMQLNFDLFVVAPSSDMIARRIDRKKNFAQALPSFLVSVISSPLEV